MKSALLAWLAGLVTTLALALLFHRFVMGPQFVAAYEAMGDPHKGLVFLSYAVLTAVMVYLYPKGYEGGLPALEGYRFGALLGLLFITPIAMLMSAAGVGLGTIIPDVLWHTFVEHAVAGSVVGVVYGREIGRWKRASESGGQAR